MGRERTDARARRDAGRSDSPRPARVAMIVHMCISRGADGEMSMGLLPGGGSLGGCGPSAAGDDSLPRRFVGCVLSSVLSSMAELSARAPPDVPPPEGVADMPVVRELIVRTLASLAVTDSKRFLDVTAPDFDPYRGSLKALGRLACVSRGYRDDTRDPYIVDALLGGLAEPAWREWARGWRGKTAAFVFAPRVDLGDVHRLLRAEHVAKHVIDASNSEHHASRRAKGEDTTARDEWRPWTLRASIAFPPERHSLPERDDAALEAHRKRRDELEREYAPHASAGQSLDRKHDYFVNALDANQDSLCEEYKTRADKASAMFVAAALLDPTEAASSSSSSNATGTPSRRPRRSCSARKTEAQMKTVAQMKTPVALLTRGVLQAPPHCGSSPTHAVPFRRRVASYALAYRTCARLRACLADPWIDLSNAHNAHRMFADMVFFVETQRTDAHDATIRDVIARGGDVVVAAYDPARVTHLIVADGCFDAARAMTPPWTRLGPDAAIATLRDGDPTWFSSPLQTHVELAMRDGKGLVPWAWIRACVEAGAMPEGSNTMLEPMPPYSSPIIKPSSPSETERFRGRFDEAWRDMHRIVDVARLRRLLRERKRLKRGLRRVKTAKDKHDSDPAVVKAKHEYGTATFLLSRLERHARCKGPQLACRDPNPDERAVFPPTQVGGVPDWPWHDKEGICGEHKGFPEVDAWEFVAQVNLRQVHASSSLLPEGLLPDRGILYFFLDRDFDETAEEDASCIVMFYPDTSDGPTWPGANPDGSAEAAHQRTNLRKFQKMGQTRFNPVMYRSAAVAPARDVLTMRPHIEGIELMPPEWAEWAELGFPDDHPLSELFDESDDIEAECEYVQNIRDAFPCPPVDVPVMLGYPIVSEEAYDFWTDPEYDGELLGTPMADVSEEGRFLLLQIAPHGPHGSWIAFLATEKALRNREWTHIHHRIYPANFDPANFEG